MQIEFLVNDGVSMFLAPENDMEEALLKQLLKQQNDFTEVKNSVVILNKSYRAGIIVGKRFLGQKFIDKDNEAEEKEV